MEEDKACHKDSLIVFVIDCVPEKAAANPWPVIPVIAAPVSWFCAEYAMFKSSVVA